MTNRFIGGLLLIVGTSIGGGMLALPMATAAGGFWHATLLLLAAWFVMTLGAFCILEVNLWLPEGSNLISMARATLGRTGSAITWGVYLLLLYALLCAYMAGGAGLLSTLLALIDIHLPLWLNALLFLALLGSIVAFGIHAVDWANRALLSTKLLIFVVLIVIMLPAIHLSYLATGSFSKLDVAVMPVITSFGFAIIMPSLRGYLHNDVKLLRLVIGAGSLVPLICYFFWDMAVQGSLTSNRLVHAASSRNSVGSLTHALSIHNHWISILAHLFISICITTSFIGVALCMTDFLSDGLKLKKQGLGRWVILTLTFGPSLLIILLHPGLFITALSYAGVTCIVLLMLLPALMVWSGRYVKKIQHGYQLWGGRWLIGFQIIASLVLLVWYIL